MATISKFEDIESWQGARTLVRDIDKLTSQGAMAKDFGFRDQIQRAAVSIRSNIAVGFERNSRKDFCRFLYMAKTSAGEVQSLLYLALDLSYIDPSTYDSLSQHMITVS